MPALHALNVECTIHLQELGVDPRTFFTGPFPAAWQARFDQNTAGLESTAAAVLTMQGTTDTVVNPNGTNQYVARACQIKPAVEYSIYPGVNHQVIPFAAMKEYVGWIAARFAGKPAPSNCCRRRRAAPLDRALRRGATGSRIRPHQSPHVVLCGASGYGVAPGSPLATPSSSSRSVRANICAVATADGVPACGSAPPATTASRTAASALNTAPASGV
jgi:hypothetical protein